MILSFMMDDLMFNFVSLSVFVCQAGLILLLVDLSGPLVLTHLSIFELSMWTKKNCQARIVPFGKFCLFVF